jgi:hypothetical protein
MWVQSCYVQSASSLYTLEDCMAVVCKDACAVQPCLVYAQAQLSVLHQTYFLHQR